TRWPPLAPSRAWLAKKLAKDQSERKMGGKKLPSVALDIPGNRGSWALFRRSIPPFLPSRIRLGLSGRRFAADAIASGRELLGEEPAGKPIESLYPFWSASKSLMLPRCDGGKMREISEANAAFAPLLN